MDFFGMSHIEPADYPLAGIREARRYECKAGGMILYVVLLDEEPWSLRDSFFVHVSGLHGAPRRDSPRTR